jgi:hypothetical protein
MTGTSLIPQEYIYVFIPLIPGPMLTDVILIYIFPLVLYLLVDLISPGLVKLIFNISKISFLFRKKPDYGFLNVGGKFKGSRIFFRAFLVNLFAFGTSALLVQLGFSDFFRATFGGSNPPEGLLHAEAIFFGTFFLASLSMLLFIPSWYMEDSGLVSYRHYPELRKTPIIEGVHKWYINVLEVYTGISTFGTIIVVIWRSLPDAGFGPALLTPIIVLINPLILTGLLALPIYIYEKRMEKTQLRIHNKFEKYNFRHFSIPKFGELEQKER